MPLTYIDIERRKTWRIGIFFLVLLALYSIVLLSVFLPFSVMPFWDHPERLPSTSWIFLFISVAAVPAAIHFWFSASDTVADVMRGLGAQLPDPQDDVHRMLLNIMQEVNVVTGNKRKIRCVVIPTLSLNALAAADLRGNAVIGITEGLLSRLSRPQIESVIAHEAHHILSGDCLETTVAASLFGTLSSVLERSGGRTFNRSYPHPALLLAWLLLSLARVLSFFISRDREYRADAAAVRMTRNPVALAETLHMLSRAWRGAGFIGSGYEMLCIVNPEANARDESEGFWADLLSTHPPIKKRIDILLAMAHLNAAALAMSPTAAPAPDTAGSAFYALNPQHQWQGPFTLDDLAVQPWLSPLTWVRTDGKEAVDRAWKDPVINSMLVRRFEQHEAQSGFSCPSCSLPLITEQYEGTRVYQCRFCGGTLVDLDRIPRILARTNHGRPCSDRIRKLAQSRPTSARMQPASGKKTAVPLLSCPKCKNPMYHGFYSAAYLLMIDRCSYCGLIWFGSDELAMLECMTEAKLDKKSADADRR